MRLSQDTLDRLPGDVVRPGYDRAAQRRGIVHLGVGAFHRAHQAVYTDAAMAAGDRDWAITGVSLRSPQVRDTLAGQSGLYTVTTSDASGERAALVGALHEVIVAPEAPDAVDRALASPDTKIVTLTVTEKGYFGLPGGDIDLAGIEANGDSIYQYLARAVGARRAAGLGPLTLVSCDNLSGNGDVLRAGLAAVLDRRSAADRAWFEEAWSCPATMVDRIVPAMTEARLDAVAARLGLRDEAALVTEPFRQWIIEDRFAGPRPRWEAGGAQFVADVRPYEAAKLRMLNGAHSALAYLGLRAGHAHVHEAIADPAIGPLVSRLMRDEAGASLDPVPGLDPAHYADTLLDRFANPALPHRLEQIAIDGSQKIVPRWLVPLAVHQARGRTCPATLSALAAWIVHVRGTDRRVDDPLADQLADLWRSVGASGIVAALFGDRGLYAAHWTIDPQSAALINDALSANRIG